jgi:cysteine-rich repeat protein
VKSKAGSLLRLATLYCVSGCGATDHMVGALRGAYAGSGGAIDTFEPQDVGGRAAIHTAGTSGGRAASDVLGSGGNTAGDGGKTLADGPLGNISAGRGGAAGCAGIGCEPQPICGDGVVAAGEECDDGNPVDSDACTSDCRLTRCGDFIINGLGFRSEVCDTGGESAACDADCTSPRCGDGTRNVAAGEECDGAGETTTCNANCTAARCGDGILNVTAGEYCDVAGNSPVCDSDCTRAVCGDKFTNPASNEGCDDGNAVNGDGCSASCAIE